MSITDPWAEDNPLSGVDGYESVDYYPPAHGGGGGGDVNLDCPHGFGPYYADVKAWIPPMPYIKGQPELPPTKTQIKFVKREGWNSWARSIAALAKGEYYTFSCMTGIHGACIGLGPASFLGKKINAFSHSLLISQEGILVHESGVQKVKLKAAQTAASDIRIYWREDNRIVYTVKTAKETLVYTSLTPYPHAKLFIFGYIYTSDDQIPTSAFAVGKVHYGAA